MKTIANNKKAYFDYFISDELEAGIELVGSEVKSIRAGGVNINDAFVQLVNGEVFLKNAYIKPYDKTGSFIPESKRNRKLLLSKNEIHKLDEKIKQKGFSCVPLKVYLKGSLVKIEIGLAKGKKLYDKRDSLKEKQSKIEIEKAIKDITRK